jgi:hypothetical protein
VRLCRVTMKFTILATAVSLAYVAGCGGEISISIAEDPGFVPSSCSSEGAHEWFHDMTLPAGVDYVEIQGAWSSTYSTVAKPQSLGTPCATASNPSACMSMLMSVPSPGTAGTALGTCGDICDEANLVETRGDTVEVASTPIEVGRALAPIDDAAKAMLVTEFTGYEVACPGGGAAPTRGGWLVMAYTYTCNSSTLHVVKVDTSGTLTEESSEVILQGSGQCAY